MPGNMKAAKQKSYHFNMFDLFCSSTWLSCHVAQETWDLAVPYRVVVMSEAWDQGPVFRECR